MTMSARCASTACPLPSGEYIAGIPVCPAHKEALGRAFARLSKPDGRVATAGRTWSPAAKSYRSAPQKEEPGEPAERKRKSARITRIRLSPQQSAVDPATAELMGCVYYITTRKNAEHVKIGTTRQASARFKQIMGASGERPRLLVAEPGSLAEESARHVQFNHIRVPGTEFFLYTDELVDHIAELRQRYPRYRDFTDVGRSHD